MRFDLLMTVAVAGLRCPTRTLLRRWLARREESPQERPKRAGPQACTSKQYARHRIAKVAQSIVALAESKM